MNEIGGKFIIQITWFLPIPEGNEKEKKMIRESTMRRSGKFSEIEENKNGEPKKAISRWE